MKQKTAHVRIREAERRDSAEISRLMNSLGRHLNKVTRKKAIDVHREKLDDLIVGDVKGKKFLFVSEMSGRISGFLLGHIIDMSLYKLGMIDDIYVDENARSAGVGTALIRKFKSACRSLGVKTIFVITPAKNIAAVEFYKEKGFKEMESAHLYMRLK